MNQRFLPRNRRLPYTLFITLGIATIPTLAQTPNAPVKGFAEAGQYNLADYGPIKTIAEAEATLQKALSDVAAKGGGVLIVPPGANAEWKLENNAPSSAKEDTVSVTIIDWRDGYERILVPANGKRAGVFWAGQHIERSLRQPLDQQFAMSTTQVIDTFIAGGTGSYSQPTTFEVKKGKGSRAYVPTIRGLHKGMYLNISGQALAYEGKFERVTIEELGWDKEKQLHYIVLSELQWDHPEKALLSNKNVVNSLTISDHGQSDNQTIGALAARRTNYAQGDSFVIGARLLSQGNNMSGAGDEGSLTFASDIYSDVNSFHSTVESVNWARQELVYAPGAVRNHTLSTSRPLINLNPKKWVTNGTIHIVAPGHGDPWDPNSTEKTGKAFQAQMFSGGAIIGSKDCGWTQEVVGRFIAIDEPTEYLDPANDPAAGYAAGPQKRTYRWYLIQKLEPRADGTKRLYVERTRWWSRNDVAPTLYNYENYTWAGHEKPLPYIIAPGAYVSDVSRAWTNSEDSDGYVYATSPRTLRLAPIGDIGTKFDFEKGDAVTQAIGQDPWNPSGLRVRHFNYLPTTLPDHSFEAGNFGRIAVDAAIHIQALTPNLQDAVRDSKDKQPAFLRGLDIRATTDVGVRFGGDVRSAALWFLQPNNRAQPMLWNVNGAPSHSLVVDPQNGGFAFKGGGISIQQGGISGGSTPANNLRGIAVPVAANSQGMKVRFERPELDANYAIMVQPSWMTLDSVTEKTKDGFTVNFGTAPTVAAKLDWMLLR